MELSIYRDDKYLLPYKNVIDTRHNNILSVAKKMSVDGSLSNGINNHFYFGLHKDEDSWVIREWAPNANRIYLIGEFNNWKRTTAYELNPIGNGVWELRLPLLFLHHKQLYKLYIEWPGGGGERIPAYCTRVLQDPDTKVFSAQIWEPEQRYEFKYHRPNNVVNPLIYECHIGMSSEEEKVSTFTEFKENVLPRIIDLGYNTIQIMALQEHPYYGSFGYQVSNFFALSSRFGTPEDFMLLVDEAHKNGIRVVMDIVHSHSVNNEAEGLSKFDGREDLYFHSGPRGQHPAWGSRCFDYGKNETRYFLLSNCKFWLETYNLDGFRFDGVTSMIYYDHGLGKDFIGYDNYFNNGVDEDALIYLGLANMLIKEIVPYSITIAEDVSGMPGLSASIEVGGIGFDYRMAMGVADHWIKWIKEKSDEKSDMGEIWWELTNKRKDEKTISYAECHDQALVGDKTLIFRLIDKEMYTSMNTESKSLIVDRGIALHKIIRLITLATAGNGYLNFMGNEFGHPEWIDFPREGNGWSYKYARRQWSLSEPDYLRYSFLRKFDKAMIEMAKHEDILSYAPKLIFADQQKNILIFKRKNCIFACNFNPTKSYTDYGFEAPEGEYKIILNSDEKEYGGFDRIECDKSYFTLPFVDEKNKTSCFKLYLYLPNRTVVILKNLSKNNKDGVY